MPLGRRGRPGLIGMAARTAVVAGTATAVSGSVQRHQQEKAQREYIQQVSSSSGGASSADELEKLAQLQSQGVITAEEFAAQKAKILA